jgi:hypothetical protein
VEDDYGVAGVVFYVDGEAVARISKAPWSTRWSASSTGLHEISVEVVDFAGNRSKTEPIVFELIVP